VCAEGVPGVGLPPAPPQHQPRALVNGIRWFSCGAYARARLGGWRGGGRRVAMPHDNDMTLCVCQEYTVSKSMQWVAVHEVL